MRQSSVILLLAAFLASSVEVATAFNLPGQSFDDDHVVELEFNKMTSTKTLMPVEYYPQSFAEGDVVELKVNKMTSTKTLMPVEYYHLPFCRTRWRRGDGWWEPWRIPCWRSHWVIAISFAEWRRTCIANRSASPTLVVGSSEQRGVKPNKVVRAIRKEYRNNWIVDNLSSAFKFEDDTTITD